MNEQQQVANFAFRNSEMSSSSLSFVGSLATDTLHIRRAARTSRVRPLKMCEDTSDSGMMMSAVTPIPGSLSDAATQAMEAVRASLGAGSRRTIVEVDTTGGDKTYTLVKSSLPFVRMMLPVFGDTASVIVALPDSGAAALAKRDWSSEDDTPQDITFDSLKGFDPHKSESGNGKRSRSPSKTPGGAFFVAPRASEVESLEKAVDRLGDLPAVVVNPDLIDMGVTGLSYTARSFRERIIDNFETAYYLKVFNWGVLLRAYPGNWGVWLDDDSSPSGFRCVRSFKERPNADIIDSVLTEEGVSSETRPVGGWASKVSRFLKTYMQG